jgi:hypothetical protein
VTACCYAPLFWESLCLCSITRRSCNVACCSRRVLCFEPAHLNVSSISSPLCLDLNSSCCPSVRVSHQLSRRLTSSPRSFDFYGIGTQIFKVAHFYLLIILGKSSCGPHAVIARCVVALVLPAS